MKLPRISIVTPSYNQAAYLEQTICSILEQGYDNLEYIVIDGGSTDGSADIIRRYTDCLAYWITESDRGQSHAINKGFTRCTGDIITFCNSDDIYLPGTLHDVAAAWRESPECGAIVGGFYYMDEHSRLDAVLHPPKLVLSTPIDLTTGPPGVYRLHQAATFYTRHALDKVGRCVREDLKYTMDRELLYRVCRHYRVVLRHRPYGAFRLHPHSKSVADILPFAREFAQLYLQSLSGDERQDRRRKQMARLHLAKGFVKFAGASGSRVKGSLSLLAALYYRPGYALKKTFYGRWLRLFGLRK